MVSKAYCAACGHYGRHSVISSFPHIRAGNVVVSIDGLAGEYCQRCQRTYADPRAARLALQEVVRILHRARPATPRPVLRAVAATVAARLVPGGLPG